MSYTCLLKSIIDDPLKEESSNPNFVKIPDLEEVPRRKRL
tara:strand:+ start:802 stop:921 length:120 start_codon:yes stop_codon:yes gene_type:complete